MLMCSKDHGEGPTVGTHYHRYVILLEAHNPLVANTVFPVQTIRTCSCSEGKTIMLLLYSSIFLVLYFMTQSYCDFVVSSGTLLKTTVRNIM